MTTLWQRLKFAAATDMDAILDKKEQKNPLGLLNKYIQEAEKETEMAGQWLQRHTTLGSKLEKELQEAQNFLEKRQAQADLAQTAGENDLSAFADQEVAAYTFRVDELRKALEENKEESIVLEQRYEEMKHKVKDMKIRQLQLMGKENATRAHHQMDKILSPELVAERIGSYDDMASYINSLGNKVEERHERSTMERRLEALEKNSAQTKEIV
ncbi:PspA/IM30 family protein [Planococcus sp. X10-3]|uniref:PspA/IM30 family protein n=1 Tax=Planococcus sp. X10-3 TaxID=3061240 RepID=UPI003BAECA7F